MAYLFKVVCKGEEISRQNLSQISSEPKFSFITVFSSFNVILRHILEDRFNVTTYYSMFIAARVFNVLHSQCVGSSYLADTFPITTCSVPQVHKLGKIRCVALSQKPSLGVLLTFALANLFLLTIIVGELS